MRRVTIEVPIMAMAAIVMASMVLAVGNAIESPAVPVVLASAPVEPRSGTATDCLEADVVALTTAEVAGHARLCYDGRDLRLTFRAKGLAPGEVYSAWLGYMHRTVPCQDTPCGPIDLSHERTIALMQRPVGGVSPASLELEFDSSVRRVQLARGEQVSLLLLRPGGLPVTYAQAVFIVPARAQSR